ncbi:hypothetical protein DPSP01_012149 [Paraphaeosphaeria sporulosa]|uniref:ADP-ribosylation n=1 Tax=Paraphaeosphaeria sporulosa TaxID=1460663 RepID=A0A177CH86_9PLEO|nr:ADP-ribosylation [Paraphaeosphaeria sporulosa]OAG06209.1 ADP-ribosylation [Paraphaeosphaeria sporulosa]
MLWQAPLALLGLFATLGNTAPLAPLGGDTEDLANVTTHSLDKRINEGVRYVWRTDGRSPSVLKASDGFQTKGWTNGYREDVSLYRHCKGAKNGASMDNDGFVSTTWKHSVAEGWVLDHHHGSAYVYKIATDEGLIDVEATLKGYSPYPHELEFAAIHSIPWKQVQGWYKYSSNGKGGTRQSEYVYNKDFSQSMYGNRPHGGSQFPLSGFPNNHPAWDKLPWARYAHCRPKNAKRAEEIFAQQSPPTHDIDTINGVEVATVAPLEARGRARGSRTSRKRPSAAGRRKKTTKKPAKKPTTGTKKCTAAMKKSGKCKDTTTPAKCTPAMKKAGKCPSTCSAAEKKSNGGTCPKCTAAEKKANGGVCPTCTAAEKKKNGGKCPPKKGECGPSKSNKARALEYVKALKAGRAGRKMKWSEGTTGAKGGKGTKAGGKTGA